MPILLTTKGSRTTPIYSKERTVLQNRKIIVCYIDANNRSARHNARCWYLDGSSNSAGKSHKLSREGLGVARFNCRHVLGALHVSDAGGLRSVEPDRFL